MSATKKFRRGEVIISEGAAGSHAYLIRSGKVEVSKMVRGEKFVLTHLGPGAIFGEMALIDDKPRSATVATLENTEVVVITRERFAHMLEHNPRALIPLFRQVFNRIRYLNQMITAFCSKVEVGTLETRPTAIRLRPLTEAAKRALGQSEVVISKLPFQIGRSSRHSIFGSNDLDLEDSEPFEISRCHCLLTQVEDSYYLVDSVSSRGTALDNIRIGGNIEKKRIELTPGVHRLQLGSDSSPYLFELEVS